MNYKDNVLDPYVNPLALQIANRDHDERLRAEGVTIEGRVKGAWNPEKLSRRGLLTDKKIRAYEKAGYYSAEFKEARRKLMEKKRGNFVERDGRLIYTP